MLNVIKQQHKTFILFILLVVTSFTSTANQTQEQNITKNFGFLVTLKAKVGMEEQVGKLISNAVQLAKKENKTLTWYAFQIDESTYGIFDTFHSEEGRQIHLHGEIAKLLLSNAEKLLSEKPSIKPIEILSSKY